VRVLVVPPAFPHPGDSYPYIFVLRQCQALAERGHEVQVAYVVPAAPPLRPKWRAYRSIPAHYVYENIPVSVIRAVVPPKMLGLRFVRAQVSKTLQTLIARFDPQIVHVHCLVPPGFLAIGLERPMVLTAHGSDAYLYPHQRSDLRRAAQAALGAAGAIVAVSDFIKREVERLQNCPVQVVYNGADPKVFAPGERTTARRALGLASEAPLIVYAGNLARSKGVFDLVDAVRRLSDLAPQVALAGAGPDATELRAAFEAARASVRFFGALTQAQLAQLFTAADAITLPSYAEGLPAVVCEAMLSGRAVVTTPVGGLPEIVRDGVTGLIAPAGDRALLAAALRRILTDASLRARLETNALEFASRHLTWSANAQAYERIYFELARSSPDKSKTN
jgi:teichuronic acid biosynthesis glycosyltransferase TuaC